ncbi:MAG: hypothetical protein IKN64_07815 [Desulfovibrio sp.]|nr:hypothetical protein [Desulfovibrio sp.]
MAYPTYVVSFLEGRARLRHAVLKTEAGMQKAREVLGKQKKIREVQPGAGSLLVFFEPSLQFSSVLAALEKELPELAKTAEEGKQTSPQCLEQLFGVSLRKLENRSLLLLLAVASLFGFVGSGSSHTALAAVVLALTARHVWVRRKAL